MTPLLLRLAAARRSATWPAECACGAAATTATWTWPGRGHAGPSATSAAGAATARTARSAAGATTSAARPRASARTSRPAVPATARAAGSAARTALTEAAPADRTRRHAAGTRAWSARPRAAWPRGVTGATGAWAAGRPRASRTRAARRAAGTAGRSTRGCRSAGLRRTRRRPHAGGSGAEWVVTRTRPRSGRVALTGRRRRSRARSRGSRPRPGRTRRGARLCRTRSGGTRLRGARPGGSRTGGRRGPGLGRRYLRADALILRERHRDGRTQPLCGWCLRRRQLLDCCWPARLGRLRSRLGGRSGPAVGATGSAPGGRRLRARPIAVRCLGHLACKFIFEPADYRRLNCRGRRPDKLTHLLELGHYGLALYAELLSEFVNPDLRHCAPSTRPGSTGPVSQPGQRVLRPASACAVHRRMLIGRSLQVSLLSSGASGCRHRQHACPATRLLAGQVLRDLPGRQCRRQAKSPRKRLAALGLFQACQARVQVRTSARQSHGDIGNYLISRDHHANQFGLRRSLPAPDAGSDRFGLPAVQLTGPSR